LRRNGTVGRFPVDVVGPEGFTRSTSLTRVGDGEGEIVRVETLEVRGSRDHGGVRVLWGLVPGFDQFNRVGIDWPTRNWRRNIRDPAFSCHTFL